jgi:hypothetical protein
MKLDAALEEIELLPLLIFRRFVRAAEGLTDVLAPSEIILKLVDCSQWRCGLRTEGRESVSRRLARFFWHSSSATLR